MKIRYVSIAKMIAALAAAIVPLFARAASGELARTANAPKKGGVYLYTNTVESIELPAVKADILVVGGGGAGANPGAASALQGGAGGGGAGGMIETNVYFASGTYKIVVGSGGISPEGQGVGGNGEPTKILLDGAALYEAFGGGGGGFLGAGADGGSGGGGSMADGGLGALGQGFGGGKSIYDRAGGGGGGAGGVGGVTTAVGVGGAGGLGKASTITGTKLYYAAGGGGGSRNGESVAFGGSGIGGNGGAAVAKATDGWRNSGSGGGGGSLNTKGGNGGSGIVVIKIIDFLPTRPEIAYSVNYNGENQLVYSGSSGVIIKKDGAIVNEIAVKDVGIYNYTVTLKEGYVWADLTTDVEVAVTVAVNKAVEAVTVESIKIEPWQIGQTPSKPVVKSTPFQVNSSDYVVKYSPNGLNEWSEEAPTEPGVYDVTIEFRTDSYIVNEPIPVVIDVTLSAFDEANKAYLDSLGYRSKITITEAIETPLEDVVMPIRIRENEPSGFKYKYANSDGSDIRFVDSEGKLIPHKVHIWNTLGESQILVKIPEFKKDAVITMCWGELVNKTPPSMEDLGLIDEENIKEATHVFTQAEIIPGVCFKNRWVIEPTISKPEWDYGDKTVIATTGEAAYGEAYYTFVSREVITNTVPNEVGYYVFRAQVDALEAVKGGSFGYESLVSFEKNVVVRGVATNGALGGEGADVTLLGRVLLANDWGYGVGAVRGQNYFCTNSVVGSYWIHGSEGKFILPYLSRSTESRLMSVEPIDELCGETMIWHLSNVRIGNLYEKDGTFQKIRNYLPLSPEALPNNELTNSVHLALGNTKDAAIYSPMYTNGIGTIYFDAVNSIVSEDGSGLGFKIVVEVCTNLVNDAVSSADEEADGEVGADVTNELIWTPVKMQALKKDGTSYFEKPFETERLALNIKNGGTAENFYRVYVELNYREPIRFRIRRDEILEDAENDKVFILVDNIVASEPSVRIDLESYGKCDENKLGKQTLGFEGAFDVKFPSVNNPFYGRGKLKTELEGEAKNRLLDYITSSMIFYRWRYLEQAESEWRGIVLDQKNGFKAVEPFTLPKDMPGDVEYYYVSRVNAPFYEYIDYTGLGLNLGDYYSEYVPVVTNRLDSPIKFESGGTNWFIRLREAKSDYEKINLIVAEDTTTLYGEVQSETNSLPMELVGNGIWRGLYKTLKANPKGVQYRFEAMNRQSDGADEWNVTTNYWAVDKSWDKLPVTDVMREASSNSWSTVTNDAVTGYLLFQIDDTRRSITIVHADYQDFNGWTDANENGSELFVGNSIDDKDKSGVSSTTTKSEVDFKGWTDMPATNNLWREAIATTTTLSYGDYDSFTDANTPNGWKALNSMFIYANYKDSTDTTKIDGAIDRALQMEGNSLGSIELSNVNEVPRGIEKITFNARLAQTIDFNDAAYYNSGDINQMTNYTFVVAGAFDSNRNKDFRGNATLSLFAYYQPRIGAYELRVEQIRAKEDNGGLTASPNGQRIRLYRWNLNSSGEYVATLLGGRNNYSDNTSWPLSDGTNGLQSLYISISNSTAGVCIAAGFRSDSQGVDKEWTKADVSGDAFSSIAYIDTNKVEQIMSGTFGLLTANSGGIFAKPLFMSESVSLMSQVYADKDKKDGALGQIKNYAGNVSFIGTETSCSEEEDFKKWAILPGRMIYDGNLKGLKAVIPSQEVRIFTKEGNKDWMFLTSTNITTFGKSGLKEPIEINVYTNIDCTVKLATGGAKNGVRTDIVIDDIEISQFRGGNWEDASGSSEDYNEVDFKFTTAWIKNEAVLLSARRTTPEDPSSICSPFYDGDDKRGLGLGMFSFKYKDVSNTNVVLLLQMATNVTMNSDGYIIDRFDERTWVTCTNFTFTAEDLAEGQRSYYLGLHGVKGVMRLVMDPQVVEKYKNEMDSEKFPEIYITEVFSRDEPTLNSSAWWGWNLRTLGAVDGRDNEKRMYLYDKTRDNPNGMSLALNNSTNDIVNTNQSADYEEYEPFLQTPLFERDVVGEITFKARKYDVNNSQPAQITLYGSRTGASTAEGWEPIKTFDIYNTIYTNFSYKTEPGKEYKAFRLAVTGVDVKSPMPVDKDKVKYDEPVRVLIDEVLVSEAIRAAFAFRKVGAFRSNLDTLDYVPNVPSAEEQPLSGESWGVQCEIFAAQLEEEIDWSRQPIVKLHWFRGVDPWGYNNWKDLPGAESAELAAAENTNLIYRSSMRKVQEGNAVIPASTKTPETVQYELELIYYTKESDNPLTNYLSNVGMWENPSWYKGYDLNAGRKDYVAYTILDNVSPGWAWINEANVLGGYDNNGINKDLDYQYVEVAAPANAKLEGWSVRMIEKLTEKLLVTNTVAVFGERDLASLKVKNMKDNMVFHVIGSPKSKESGKLKKDNGTLDGVWSFTNKGDVMNTTTGVILPVFPIGVQLVRKSGIVEHEVGFIGENLFGPDDFLYGEYNASNFVNQVNKLIGSSFIYVGADDKDGNYSLSVITNRGEATSYWVNNVRCTPGEINDTQKIVDLPPTPNGSSILVYANLNTSIPRIRQSFGGVPYTDTSLIFSVPKELSAGTNISYKVDKWHELKSVTVNGIALPIEGLKPERDALGAAIYKVTIAENAKDNINIEASAKLSDDLVEKYGLGPDNKYRDAVIDWLEKGESLVFGPWEKPNSDEIYLAEYQSLSGVKIAEMTLTQMYWLDIDPTASNFVFRGGMAKAPEPKMRSLPIGDEPNDYIETTNYKMGVTLYITNKTENVDSKYYNQPAWAPYVLRGRGKGETSLDYSAATQPWSNVTFKVTGFLNNSLTQLANKNNWIPLRWFVFDGWDDENGKSRSFNDEFTTYIEISDPFSKQSPGYNAGWYDWHLDNPTDGLFFSWSIDTRLNMFPVEILKSENYYENE